MTARNARLWHGLTAVVVVAALLLQLVLVLTGGRVLDESKDPGLGIGLLRFIAYFTVQSNLLVAIAVIQLARDPSREGTGFQVVRLAGIVGIFVTGIVHFTLLRPLLNLEGADWVADKALHMAVPLLAVVGWVLFGPRPRVELRDVRLALCFPLAWTLETMVVGALTGWYPYPFLDPDAEHGTVGVVVSIAAITVFFLLVFALARAIDQRADPAPRAWDPYRGGTAHP